MSSHSEVRYYPVGNGDTTLITTPEGQEVLVDCKLADSDPPLDVRSDLVERLGKRRGKPYLPAFILTHGDQDHCLGFDRTFHTGPPGEYEGPDDDDDLPPILIGTLWFSPHILSDDELCDDAEAYRKEAKRRLKLHKNGDDSKSEPGNRVVVIGHKSDEGLGGLPSDIRFAAGSKISSVDHTSEPSFRLFVHAPFKENLDNEDVKRNDTSIAFTAAFDEGGEKEACKFFFGGDAKYTVLEEIRRQTEVYHENSEWLEFDVLQTPHHCSWSSFGKVPYEDEAEPSEGVINLLSRGRDGAFVLASSKPVEDDGDNPPHHPAKEEYVDIVGSSRFLCSMEHPNEDNPQPIVFTMTADGPARKRITNESSKAAAVHSQEKSNPEYG